MKASITYIQLKGPLKFFALSLQAMRIIKQLKSANSKAFKKKGVWTKHYTMTLWESEEDMVAFARSGAHLNAMKESAKLAKEIRTVTIDAEQLPTWKVAHELLADAKPIRYQ